MNKTILLLCAVSAVAWGDGNVKGGKSYSSRDVSYSTNGKRIKQTTISTFGDPSVDPVTYVSNESQGKKIITSSYDDKFPEQSHDYIGYTPNENQVHGGNAYSPKDDSYSTNGNRIKQTTFSTFGDPSVDPVTYVSNESQGKKIITSSYDDKFPEQSHDYIGYTPNENQVHGGNAYSPMDDSYSTNGNRIKQTTFSTFGDPSVDPVTYVSNESQGKKIITSSYDDKFPEQSHDYIGYTPNENQVHGGNAYSPRDDSYSTNGNRIKQTTISTFGDPSVDPVTYVSNESQGKKIITSSYDDKFPEQSHDYIGYKPNENQIQNKKKTIYKSKSAYGNSKDASANPNSHISNSNIPDRTDDYISLNRHQYMKILQNYDTILKQYEERYLGRLDGVNLVHDMVASSIVQNEEVLNPLELLSDVSKECVTKHRPALLSEMHAKMQISECYAQASNKLTQLLSNLRSVKSSLEYYYENTFEKGIKKCDKHNPSYSSCVIRVVYETNQFFVRNQKTFETALDAAECSAKANVKYALDCSYSTQSQVTTLIAENALLINNCILGEPRCLSCKGFTCNESVEMPANYLQSTSTLTNPLYSDLSGSNCVLIKVY